MKDPGTGRAQRSSLHTGLCVLIGGSVTGPTRRSGTLNPITPFLLTCCRDPSEGKDVYNNPLTTRGKTQIFWSESTTSPWPTEET